MILEYLVLINLVSGSIFTLDKRRAAKGRWRIPEHYLHLIEFLGGVLLILPLMYLIRHKNQKFSYYAYTWIIGIAWTGLLYTLYW